MQVELNNFRCWKKQSFIFNNTGIILISGSSGSGKSSLLNAIYFAITGNGNKIVTHGEKKCSVTLKFTDESSIIKEITRTKSPCRLTVIYDNNSYEDDEAQKIIDNYYGNYFQQTSYMTQKMIHSFLNLNSTERMNFLQKFITENTDPNNNSLLLKKKCKDKLNELKKIHIEHKSKITMYTNELNISSQKIINYIKDNKYLFDNIDDINSFNLDDNFIINIMKNIDNIQYNSDSLKEMKEKKILLFEIYKKYNECKVKIEECNKYKNQILKEINNISSDKLEMENKVNYNDYKGDNYFNFLEESKSYYTIHNKYNSLIKNVETNCQNVLILINKQTAFYKNQIEISIDNKNKIYNSLSSVYADIDYIKNNIDKWNKSTQTIIEYCNYITELSKNYDTVESNIIETIDNNIIQLNNEIENNKIKLKDKQEELNSLKNNWNLKNKLHKCPKCHINIRLQPNEKEPNKFKLIEEQSNIKLELNKETYNLNVNKLEEDINTLTITIDNKQKEIYNKETRKNQIIEYNMKLDNYKKRIKRADNILIKYFGFDINNNCESFNVKLYQKKINDINKWLEEYNKYDNEILNLENNIKNINEKTDIKISDIFILDKNKLYNSQYINDLINKIKSIVKIDEYLNKLLNDTIKILQEMNKIVNNDSNILISLKFKPSVTEDEINNELLIQSKYKNNYEMNLKLLEQLKNKYKIESDKLIEINNKLKDIEYYINENYNIINEYNTIENNINECHKIEDKYNKYKLLKTLYEQWKRLKDEKRIENYLYDTVSDDIISHEILLNKINETESVTLTQNIDIINYYVNEYLEKFFPNDSIMIDIVPFKEYKNNKNDKNEMKPVIDIKVCYKGEEVELTSLSGGEYDRVALAIMLSFNKISKSNMILLDESVASLDADLTNDILNTLKENMIDKRIIVVAHQLNTGLFDQIINTK